MDWCYEVLLIAFHWHRDLFKVNRGRCPLITSYELCRVYIAILWFIDHWPDSEVKADP